MQYLGEVLSQRYDRRVFANSGIGIALGVLLGGILGMGKTLRLKPRKETAMTFKGFSLQR